MPQRNNGKIKSRAYSVSKKAPISVYLRGYSGHPYIPSTVPKDELGRIQRKRAVGSQLEETALDGKPLAKDTFLDLG